MKIVDVKVYCNLKQNLCWAYWRKKTEVLVKTVNFLWE